MSHGFVGLLESATSHVLRDALDIWQAGVRAVTPWELIQKKLVLDDYYLTIDDACVIDLRPVRRLIVVGAGKASAAMAAALHHQIIQRLPKRSSPEVVGWINAPEDAFQEQLPGIYLHAARPWGMNIPTQAAVDGTRQILQLVSAASRDDVVLCLLSGGGSALLVAPQAGISLSDKQAVARSIAEAGGDIRQLNTVRRCLSDIKGGGLARACKAGRLISLILSDVLGDPLDLIASGPTFVESNEFLSTRQAESHRLANFGSGGDVGPSGDTPEGSSGEGSSGDSLEDTGSIGDTATAKVGGSLGGGGDSAVQQQTGQSAAERLAALAILKQLQLIGRPELQSVVRWLSSSPLMESPQAVLPAIENIVLGNNADAVDAAGVRAVELGYRYSMHSARQPEGDVSQVAIQSLNSIDWLCKHRQPDCWISGGEPTVHLPKEGHGKGGRNQQLSLCVLEQLLGLGWPGAYPGCDLAFVSGGTDGEDGPTDAAGACFDSTVVARMDSLQCFPLPYRERADAYHFFSHVGGLMKTGPTGTNVCDLRVALRRRA
jgi:glycerate-2-kinase